MAKTRGIVKSVRIDQEGRATVLRFVVESGNDLIPVEMRGNKVKGVLEAGDEVIIESQWRRDHDGIIRPGEIKNKSTNSLVSVKRHGFLVKLIVFLFGVAISVASGVISALIANSLSAERETPIDFSPEADLLSHYSPESILPIVTGAVVGLLVFYFVYLKPRRH